MFEQWSNDEDMSHGFVVPIVVLWIVWRERERWRTLPAEPSWWGLAVLAAGAGMQFIAALGAGLFASSVAFLMSVAGAVLVLGGFAYLRAWALPLLLALFMLPKLALVYNQVTLPLQLFASRMAASILTASGIAVIREGNILDVAGRRVSVVEACNGIRYLLSLRFMAVVFDYLSNKKSWMRNASYKTGGANGPARRGRAYPHPRARATIGGRGLAAGVGRGHSACHFRLVSFRALSGGAGTGPATVQ
jgi:exosortase